jgi:hypothetical protein
MLIRFSTYLVKLKKVTLTNAKTHDNKKQREYMKLNQWRMKYYLTMRRVLTALRCTRHEITQSSITG